MKNIALILASGSGSRCDLDYPKQFVEIDGKTILELSIDVFEHNSLVDEIIIVTNSTKKNLELRAEAEFGACEGKLEIAKRAKELGYDAIHDTVHEMAKDEARHGKGFDGLLKRYFA